MTDNVFVFNPFGKKLDQIDVAVQRQSRITLGTSAAHANFTITARNAKATAQNLRYGNIVYVTSSISGLVDYAAIIWPGTSGTQISDGLINFNVRAYEWILASRYTMAYEPITGTPGEVARALLKSARRVGFLPISTDDSGIDLGGIALSKEYNAYPIYDALNELAKDNGYIWYLQPSVDKVTNQLSLKLIWDAQSASSFATRLTSNGDNNNMVISKIYETGDIANHVISYGRFSNWSSPVYYEEKNSVSISAYGIVVSHVIMDNTETTSAGLVQQVRQYLAEHAFPVLEVDCTITAAPYPKLGDICTVELPPNNGFIIDRRGNVATMQVTNLVETPTDNTYIIHLKEVTL